MFYLHTDGGSRGNPGPSAIGVVLYDKDHNVIQTISEVIPNTTNSVAEYTALIRGLKLALQHTSELAVFMDSEFIIKQMNGDYKVKTPHIIPLFNEVKALAASFKVISFTHVPRENPYQSRADFLVNAALDTQVI